MESVRRNGVCLRGTMGIPEFSRSGGLQSVDMKFRRALDLFASVVSIESKAGVKTRHQNIDIVIVKEQLEGFCEYEFVCDNLIYHCCKEKNMSKMTFFANSLTNQFYEPNPSRFCP